MEAKNILHVFLVREDSNHPSHLQVFGNRQLVWEWISGHGSSCVLKKSSGGTAVIRTYDSLCHYWHGKYVLEVSMIDDKLNSTRYSLIKAPVQRR